MISGPALMGPGIPPRPESTEEEKEGLEEEQGENSLHKCIRDPPLRWTSEDLNKLVAEKGLVFRSSRKRKRSPVSFVEFECDEHVLSAKEKLDGLSIHSKFLKVQRLTSWLGEDNQPAGFRRWGYMDESAATNKGTDICDVVTPLAKLPYEEQLEKKRAQISQVLKKLVCAMLGRQSLQMLLFRSGLSMPNFKVV